MSFWQIVNLCNMQIFLRHILYQTLSLEIALMCKHVEKVKTVISYFINLHDFPECTALNQVHIIMNHFTVPVPYFLDTLLILADLSSFYCSIVYQSTESFK